MKQLMLNIDKDSDLWIGIFSATSQKIQTYVVCVPDDIFHRGSNVVVAAVHAIHTEQSTVTTQDMPCHKMQMKSEQHHQMQMAHQDMTSMTKCHDQQVPNQQHCEDCNHPSHCQTVSFTLDQNIPELSALSVFERPIHLITAYQARHLAGYWQEILRPPKA